MDPTRSSWSLYYRLPAFAQNVALSVAGRRRHKTRYGAAFDERLEFLQTTDTWDRSRISAYQDDQVATLVDRAYRETDYYRKVMDDRGLHPREVRTVADLAKLPILTKGEIRQNFDRLVSSRATRRDLLSVETSGSTGAPLRLLTTREAIGFKWAVWWRHRRRFGIRPGDLHTNLTPKPLASPGQRRPPYWRWNRFENQAIIPMQQMVPDKVEAIVEFLERTPFAFYSGYPSILHSLAVMATDLGLSVSRGPRVIFTSAEAVLDQQRIDLERFAGAPIAEMYGFNEAAGNASTCPEGNFHEDFEFGHLECVDPVVEDETGRITGRIIATGFSTTAFPLIRYEVDDFGTWMPDDYNCGCGRQSRVLASIEGRWEDYIVSPDGQKTRRLGDIFKEMPNLKQFQIVQRSPERVTLRLAVRDGYAQTDEERLRRRVALWIDASLAVDFSYVDVIEPAPNGKYQRIVNTIGDPMDRGAR